MADPTALHVIFSKVPYLGQPGEFGPFHRLQCPHINELMSQSGLIGGGRSYGIGLVRVHAFVGPLPEQLGGIEFWTGVEPYPYSPRGQAFWNAGDPRVVSIHVDNRTLAAIPATIVKRVDSYAYCRSCRTES